MTTETEIEVGCGQKPRHAITFQQLKEESENSFLEPPEEVLPGLHLDCGQLELISGAWPPKL